MAFRTGQTVESAREPALAESAAPRVVEEFLAEVLAESRRRAELEAFIKSVHGKALGTAHRALELDDDAQDAVAETYAKLLAGKTAPRHFFRALNQTIIDRIRARKRESGREGRPEDLEAHGEPISWRMDDQDPLDVLIHREDESGRQRMLAAAKRDPRWRYIKLRTWAAPLRGECAESAPSNA